MTNFEPVNRAFEAAQEIFPPGAGHNGPPVDPRTPQGGGAPDPDELMRECAGLALNDFGNGKRLCAYFGHDILNVPRVGWFVWDGRCWQPDEDGLEVRRLAQRVSGKVEGEAAFLALEPYEVELIAAGDEAQAALDEIMRIPAARRSEDQKAQLVDFKAQVARAGELRKKLAKMRTGHHSHAKAAGNSTQISNMMREAQVDLYRRVEHLNENKIMFNVGNCVLHFEEVPAHPVTGKRAYVLRQQPHARELLLTKIMAADYDPDAKCPLFVHFLQTILPDAELRDFVKRWLGYSITGLTTEHKLAFWYGSGRNGKSTLLELIARIMGAYASSVPIQSLSGTDQGKGGDATPDLARLPGARMVRASEPERGARLKEAQIKHMTGGAEMMMRRLMQEFVVFQPEFSLTIDGNYKPDIRGTDDGIWGRVLLVPFVVHIAKEDIDKELPQKLWAERNGILNWLLEGCKEWLEGGLRVPQMVEDATAEYRKESDPVGEFIDACCEVTGNSADFTRSKEMNEAFSWWQVASGTSAPWGTRTIFKHFKDKADFHKGPEGQTFEHDKSNNTGWRGIRLTDEYRQRRADDEAQDRYNVS